MPSSKLRQVLWADFTAGSVGGSLLLVLSSWLQAIYSIPRLLLLVMGVAGLLYAALAFAVVAFRPVPSFARVGWLGSANLVWAALCVVAALVLAGTASPLGLAHLVLEAVFVAWLGINELRLRSTTRPGETGQRRQAPDAAGACGNGPDIIADPLKEPPPHAL